MMRARRRWEGAVGDMHIRAPDAAGPDLHDDLNGTRRQRGWLADTERPGPLHQPEAPCVTSS